MRGSEHVKAARGAAPRRVLSVNTDFVPGEDYAEGTNAHPKQIGAYSTPPQDASPPERRAARRKKGVSKCLVEQGRSAQRLCSTTSHSGATMTIWWVAPQGLSVPSVPLQSVVREDWLVVERSTPFGTRVFSASRRNRFEASSSATTVDIPERCSTICLFCQGCCSNCNCPYPIREPCGPSVLCQPCSGDFQPVE